MSRHRIAKIIETRSFNNKLDGMDDLLEALDFMDKRLDAFKTRYRSLKEEVSQGE